MLFFQIELLLNVTYLKYPLSLSLSCHHFKENAIFFLLGSAVCQTRLIHAEQVTIH